MIELRDVMKPYEMRVRANLSQLCSELSDLKSTAMYPKDSMIEALARDLTVIPGIHLTYATALNVIHTMIDDAAREFVILSSL